MHLVNGIKRPGGLFWGKPKVVEPPKVNYPDFRRFVEEPFKDVPKLEVGSKNGKTEQEPLMIRRHFSGIIGGSLNGLDGRYLDAEVVKGGELFTLILTGIDDPKLLSDKIRRNGGNGDYVLSGDDLPGPDQKINGYHLQVISGGDKGSVVINGTDTEDSKGFAGVNTVIAEITGEYFRSKETGLGPLRWLIGQSRICSAGTRDQRGPMLI